MDVLHKIKSRAASLPLNRHAVAATTLLLSELDRLGWQRSLRDTTAVDPTGRAIPWWTYAANAWLSSTILPEHRAFEFGSGNSTLWLATRVAEVHSVEHDAKWAAFVQKALPDNVHYNVVHSPINEVELPRDADYLRPLDATPGDFDLVVVDGEARVTCALAAADRVGEHGLILLDDADRTTYRPAHEQLQARGFGRVDFFGPKPGVGYLSMTSLFCRDIRPWMRRVGLPVVTGY